MTQMMTAQEMRSEIIKNKIRTEGLTQRMISAEEDILALGGGASTINTFKTIAVSGQPDVVANAVDDTLTLAAGANISLTTDGAGTVTIAGIPTVPNTFGSIAVGGQSTITADSSTDTLTLIAGTGISLTTDATSDSVTITNTVTPSTTDLTGYYLSTCSSAFTPEENLTAFIADCNAAKAAGLTLLMPNELITIGDTSRPSINLEADETLHITGYGPNSKIAFAGRYNGTSGEGVFDISTDPAHGGSATDYTISSVTNVHSSSTGNLPGSTVKITLSSVPTDIEVGSMVSIAATNRLTYRFDAGDYSNNEFNWTREMAQVALVDGADVYLSTPLFYSASNYNSAVYKILRVYPANTTLRISNLTLTTTSDPYNQNCGDTDADNIPYTGVLTATSPSVGTGSKSFTVSTGKSWTTSDTVVVFSKTSSAYMKGTVTSYNSGTGALVVNVTSTGGSGTFSNGEVQRVISRNSYIARIVGIQNVHIDSSVIIDGAWGSAFNLNSTIGAIYEPQHYNLVNILPGNSSVLGYAPAWDGANLAPQSTNNIKFGGRHNNTTVFLEEDTFTLDPTSLGSTTTLTYTNNTGTSAPDVGDYIYVDFSSITGMSSATGVYLITARSAPSITINLNSSALSDTGGTAIATLFRTDVLYRYGSTYGARFLGGYSINTTGAMLDPHENAVNCTWGNANITNGVGRSWSATARRPCNSRGLNDTFENVVSAQHEAFISLDGFARNFGFLNTTTLRSCSSLGVSTFDSTLSPQYLFQLVGDSTVTDNRKLVVDGFNIQHTVRGFLTQPTYSAGTMELSNIKCNADVNLHTSGTSAAVPSVPFIELSDGVFTLKDSVFDFKYMSRTTFMRFLRVKAGSASAAKVKIDNCKFLNIPVPSSVTNYFLATENPDTEFTLTNNVFEFVSTGGTSGRLFYVNSTGCKLNLIGNTFTGMANISIGLRIESGMDVDVFEYDNVYDTKSLLTLSGTGTLRLISDCDTQSTSASTTAVITEETLQTRTLPANSFTKPGKKLKFQAWGTTANNANTKTLRVKFGSTTIFSRNMTTSAANNWSVEGYIIETGSNAQTYVITSVWDGSTQVTPSRGTSTQTTSSPITFSVTGQNGTASAGDITCSGLILEAI